MLHALGYNVYLGLSRLWKIHAGGQRREIAIASLIQWMSDARLAYDEALAVAPDPSKMIVYGKSLELAGWRASRSGSGDLRQI